MAKKTIPDTKNVVVLHVDPKECPFREFRDHELSADYWGLSTSALRTTMLQAKTTVKPPADYVWVDEQTQPLPRSVRQYLHGWIRAEELAMSRWDAEVLVFEENNGAKMSVTDIQLSHAQVLFRSSFCRRVLSACFILERLDQFSVEHQWENFLCNITPEGWRARYHIYSPGTKPGGGLQHRPGLSKNGCYLVRLFYLGAWRCVWVSDQVPVDATDSPLLPFSPLLSHAPATKTNKQAPAMVTSQMVYLWPLLLCKALLKLAAPDMNSDEDNLYNYEDEDIPEFNMMHCLTGAMNITFNNGSYEDLWQFLISEVPLFSWDDDDDTLTSTVKSRSTKKPTTKEIAVAKRRGTTTLTLVDTKELPAYALPGLTPAYEMNLLVTMTRDVPLKKPLPEPVLPLWKYYRWVDWARRHGLYEAYDCPRTRYIRVNGLMKLSYAPHLLDVQSTESITFGFRQEHDKSNPETRKGTKEANRSATAATTTSTVQKEELREWIPYKCIYLLIKDFHMLYYPSMFQFTSAVSNPPMRITKTAPNKALDVPASKSAPLYLQIDGPDVNKVRISLNTLHPRVLLNCSVPLVDYIEPAYMILERFEWFKDCQLPVPKGFVETRGYDSIELDFQPGRHFCRIWVHSRLNWHLMVLSDSTLLLGSRDTIQSAAVRDCHWASKFLSALGLAFTNWTRFNRSSPNVLGADRDFFMSYQPDLTWDPKVVGYNKALLHWMFRQALQAQLRKKLTPVEFNAVSAVLRFYFCDPDFGFPAKPFPQKPLTEIKGLDPCDCVIPETEELEADEEQMEEQIPEETKVDEDVMNKLLTTPTVQITSQVCELATEELPCGLLKEKRDKVIRKHEAATYLQALWRGTWTRKCLNRHIHFTPDISKLVMENAFGNIEALSSLMNQFFLMYPGAKYAYSVASALSGEYGLNQYPGITSVTPNCKWVPYFQGVFYCHGPVKVHFDLQSSQQHSTVAVYDNDTGVQLPQVYNAHVTFDFTPNIYGYTIMGHGTLNQSPGIHYDVHWQLTVLASTSGLFHICDNESEICNETPLSHASKLHIDEIFIPNRRNILGGIQLFVSKHEAVSFRAAATSPDLEMTAILRTKTEDEVEEIARCSGTGVLNWPYIWLEPTPTALAASSKAKDYSQVNSLTRVSKPKSFKLSSAKKSAIKLKDHKIATIEKQYSIEVIAQNGWPLSLVQWARVDEVRNSHEVKVEITSKKPVKEKATSAKVAPPVSVKIPQPNDAYVELECSVALAGGATARRDDERDLQFDAAIKSWDANEVGRNLRGAQIRKEFRTEFLEAPPLPPSESAFTVMEEDLGEEMSGEELKKEQQELNVQQGPSPATETELLETTFESEEELKYLALPEQLQDKFIPLYFLPFCTKDRNDNEAAMESTDMAEAAKKDRLARKDAAFERLNELQKYNEIYVLGRQRSRCQLLEKLFVDSEWSDELNQVLEERDEAIACETLNRNLSAIKKKLDIKKK